MKWVYFIKPIGMDGPIKIGCSYSPDQRRKTLEFWSPFPLEILAEWQGGAVVERQFHAMFSASHRHHEWFDVTDELLAVISQIKAGTFDGSTLPDPQQLPRKAKDLSYMTAGWKYERSVRTRIDNIVFSVDLEAAKALDTRFARDIGDLDDLGVELTRPAVEAKIAELRAQAATMPRRRPRPRWAA